MPEAHQKHLDVTPQKLLENASQIGDNAKNLVQEILGSKRFHEQSYRSCLGLLRLEKVYSSERLEKACYIALVRKVYRYRYVRAILEKGQDLLPVSEVDTITKPVIHENIRGNEYYES